MQKITELADASWLTNASTGRLFKALNRNGYEARAVGGAIRNSLLQKPVKDIDIATTAPPEITSKHAEEAGLKVIPTGLQHGTVTVIVDSIPYEVTTLRRDVETDGRHAVVAFTDDWVADASRRDFTMNALYVDAEGTIHDPLNGYNDLMANKVRFIGTPSERIQEDYLRILRYFRFKAEYGLDTIDKPSLHACVEGRKGLEQLSAERINTEIFRLLDAPSAVPVIELMFNYGIIVQLLGSVVNPNALKHLIEIDKVLKHRSNSCLKFAILSLFIPEDAIRITKRLKLSNDKCNKLKKILSQFPAISRSMTEHEARIALYLTGQEIYQNRILYAWTRSGDAATDKSWKKHFSLPEKWTIPTFPIKGRDLLEIGYPKGPELGETLRLLEKFWIHSDFKLTQNKLMQIACKVLHNR